MSLIYNPIRLQRTSRPSAVTGGPVRRKRAAACGRFCWETVQGSVEAMKFCLSPIAVAVLALHALPSVAQEASEHPAAATATSDEPSKADPTPPRAVPVQDDLPSTHKVDAGYSTEFTAPPRVQPHPTYDTGKIPKREKV